MDLNCVDACMLMIIHGEFVHVQTAFQTIGSLTDPITRSPSHGKRVSGVICLHVDDLFCVGAKEFYRRVVASTQKGLSNCF